MIGRLAGCIAFGIASCIWTTTAFAQSCKVQVTCAGYNLYYADCSPPLPPGATNCSNNGPFSAICDVPSYQCAPPDAPEETCPTCGGGGPKAVAGAPISLATGNTYIEQMDLRIPGLSGFTLVRTWNSKWPVSQASSKVGLFGPNWRANYEERVFLGSDGYMKYARGDGSFWSFGFQAYGPNATFLYQISAPANEGATLTSGSTYWTITFRNGEQRLFDKTSGSLFSIIDRNGNATQLAYDVSNRLITVTDPAGRHLYFTYNGASYQVAGVTSDVGITLSYTYDAQGRLIGVTRPDLSFSFEYDANSLITAVKDSQGKILESHTYDSLGRGLTSSRADGVDAVTVAY